MLYLNLDSLLKFTNATPTSRNMIEGQKNINSGMIILCGASSKCSEAIELYALHLQSVMTLDPHTLTGTLCIKNNNNEALMEAECSVEIRKMSCSCKAGTSQQCKHIVAVLLYCNRNDLNKLELLSSTDMKCLWKKHKNPVLEQFQAEPTRSFCCIKQNRLPALSVEIQESILNRLIECNEQTALAKHRNRNITITPVLNIASEALHKKNNNMKSIQAIRTPFKQIQNNLNMTHTNIPIAPQHTDDEKDYTQSVLNNAMLSEELNFLTTATYNLPDCCNKIYNENIFCNNVYQVAQETKNCKAKWKKERKFRITGSRCYSLFTYSKNDWPEKSRKYFWAKEFSNKYVKHGNMFENVARILYASHKNVFVQECGLIIAKTEPWLAYSPDGIVIKDKKAYSLLEIKCPFELENTSNTVLKQKCKFIKLEVNEVSIKKNHQYYAQVQCGMALLNLKTCDFIVHSNVSNSIRIINICYDKKYVQKLFSELKKRFFEKILHEICVNSRVL